MGKKSKSSQGGERIYISPEEVALRWCCARSTVDRIIKREGMSRLYLGTGKNGIVRLMFDEIAAYEAQRLIR